MKYVLQIRTLWPFRVVARIELLEGGVKGHQNMTDFNGENCSCAQFLVFYKSVVVLIATKHLNIHFQYGALLHLPAKSIISV